MKLSSYLKQQALRVAGPEPAFFEWSRSQNLKSALIRISLRAVPDLDADSGPET